MVEGDVDFSTAVWFLQIFFTWLGSELFRTCTDDLISNGCLWTTVEFSQRGVSTSVRKSISYLL